MKRITLLFVLSIAFAIPCLLNASSLDNFTIMTEHYPPYNFEQDGQLKGFAIDVMVEILKRTHSKKTLKDIQLLPWARSYNDIQEKPNTILFSMTRSKERENMFKWVGPISPTKIVILAKKTSKIKINSSSDIKKYKIGAIRDDIGHQLLTKNGVIDIDLSSDMITDIKKMDAGRIDLWAYEENVARWELKNQGKNPSDYETVYTLLSGELFIAFNKGTSDATIIEVQNSLNDIKKDGTYQKIVNKYLK